VVEKTSNISGANEPLGRELFRLFSRNPKRISIKVSLNAQPLVVVPMMNIIPIMVVPLANVLHIQFVNIMIMKI